MQILGVIFAVILVLLAALAVAGVLFSLSDIRRYLRIRRM